MDTEQKDGWFEPRFKRYGCYAAGSVFDTRRKSWRFRCRGAAVSVRHGQHRGDVGPETMGGVACAWPDVGLQRLAQTPPRSVSYPVLCGRSVALSGLLAGICLVHVPFHWA